MQGNVFGYQILPDQMQVFKNVFILFLVPFFDYIVYPVFNKCNLLVTPLQKIVIGGFIACGSFVVAGCLELFLQQSHPVLPPVNQIGFIGYNGIDPTWNCPLPNISISTQLTDEVEVGVIHLKNDKYLSDFINYTNNYIINSFVVDCENGIEIIYDEQRFTKPYTILTVS